jgi:hypothetical protein
MTTARISTLGHAVYHLAAIHGEAFATLPATARLIMAGEVADIYTADNVTWSYAVSRFGRRIGNDLTAYANAIVEGN